MRWVGAIILFLVFVSCEKQTSWELSSNGAGKLVFEANISSEYKQQVVRVSKSAANAQSVPEGVSQALLTVRVGDSLFQFTESLTEPGVYYSNQAFAARKNVKTIFKATINGVSYEAADITPPNNNIQALRYSKNAENGLYKIDWVATMYNAQHTAMWEVQLDWSGVEGYQNKPVDSCRARVIAFTLSSLDVMQIYAPEKEDVYFPKGTLITEKKYSLSPAYTEFYRALLRETQWRGGYFDEAPGVIPTNVSNGAQGFVGSTNVISLSLIVE